MDTLVYEMMNIGYSQHDDMADAAADNFHPDIYRPGRMSKARAADYRDPTEQWNESLPFADMNDPMAGTFATDGTNFVRDTEMDLPYDVRNLMGM